MDESYHYWSTLQSPFYRHAWSLTPPAHGKGGLRQLLAGLPSEPQHIDEHWFGDKSICRVLLGRWGRSGGDVALADHRAVGGEGGCLPDGDPKWPSRDGSRAAVSTSTSLTHLSGFVWSAISFTLASNTLRALSEPGRPPSSCQRGPATRPSPQKVNKKRRKSQAPASQREKAFPGEKMFAVRSSEAAKRPLTDPVKGP